MARSPHILRRQSGPKLERVTEFSGRSSPDFAIDLRRAPEPDFGILALQDAGPCGPRRHADLYFDAAVQGRPPEHGTPKRSKVSTPVSAPCTEIVISGYRGGIRGGELRVLLLEQARSAGPPMYVANIKVDDAVNGDSK